MRHDAEVHARGAAGPMTNVSYFVGAGFRHWRRVNPELLAEGLATKLTRAQARCPIAGVTLPRHCDAMALFALSLALSLALALIFDE
jgi:hypothetical protein